MRGRVLLCVCCNLHIYLFHLTHTSAWRNFHWGQGGHVPPTFRNPVCVPPLYKYVYLITQAVIATEEHTASESERDGERARARERAHLYLFNIVVQNKVRNHSNVYYRTVKQIQFKRGVISKICINKKKEC